MHYRNHRHEPDHAFVAAEDFQYEDFGSEYEGAEMYPEDDFDDEIEVSEEEVSSLQEIMWENMEGMDAAEATEFATEFIGALASALPAVLSAAPSIISGVSGLLNSGGRRPSRRVPVRRPTPPRRPVRRPRGSCHSGHIAMLNRKIDRLTRMIARR
ncbi:MAG: hypothetical protein AAF206_06715 [Bacteroidota bacterium]